jgi:hypothetical protein
MKKFKTFFKGSQGLNCIASGAINFDPVVTVDAKMASSTDAYITTVGPYF